MSWRYLSCQLAMSLQSMCQYNQYVNMTKMSWRQLSHQSRAHACRSTQKGSHHSRMAYIVMAYIVMASQCGRMDGELWPV